MKIKNLFNEEEEEREYNAIKLNNKEFRIYNWSENIGDFSIPKGFRLAEYFEFIELFDNKLIKCLKEGYEFYFTKHFSKIKQKEGFLSMFYLDWNSDLNCGSSNLSYSNDYGRVVLIKISSEGKE